MLAQICDLLWLNYIMYISCTKAALLNQAKTFDISVRHCCSSAQSFHHNIPPHHAGIHNINNIDKDSMDDNAALVGNLEDMHIPKTNTVAQFQQV
jgi:hypothetical protein